MKHLVAGEALGIPSEKQTRIEAGKVYGHLEVVEEMPHRPGKGGRRFRCRCLNVPDKNSGKMCGQLTVKATGDLTKGTKFRACKGCTEVYMKEVRARWNRGGSF